VLVLVLRSRGVPLFAGADEDVAPAAPDQPPVATEPLIPDQPAATPRWGRGNASSSD
ncbi:rhomboid family intramembrane serine protease, partial [Mesorhizobium sp. M7A.F.Ca.CA.002.10.1.1]